MPVRLLEVPEESSFTNGSLSNGRRWQNTQADYAMKHEDRGADFRANGYAGEVRPDPAPAGPRLGISQN